MRLVSPSITNIALGFGLINFAILVYVGAPVPPEPILSILGIVVVNIILFAYTPAVLSHGGDRPSTNDDSEAQYDISPAATPSRASRLANHKRLQNIVWVRYSVVVETYLAIMVRVTFKDGKYSSVVRNEWYSFWAFFGVVSLLFGAALVGGVLLDMRANIERQTTSDIPLEDVPSAPKPTTETDKEKQLFESQVDAST